MKQLVLMYRINLFLELKRYQFGFLLYHKRIFFSTFYILKGFYNTLEKGCLSGNKITGVLFRLLDGLFTRLTF